MCKKALVDKLFEEGVISPAEKQKFYCAVHTFYSETFSYGIQKLPINNLVLKHSVFVDISKRDVTSFEAVLRFAEKFKLGYDPAVKVNALSGEFLDYQMFNDHDVPNSVWQKLLIIRMKKTSTTELIFYGNILVQ